MSITRNGRTGPCEMRGHWCYTHEMNYCEREGLLMPNMKSDDKFRVSFSVQIYGADGGGGDLHLSAQSEPLQLTAERMAELIAKLDEIVGEFQ